MCFDVLCLKLRRRRNAWRPDKTPPSTIQEKTSNMPLPVTEDTPPDMLAGAMDVRVILPSGRTVNMSVERSTPMMDLLVQLTTAHKLSLAGHMTVALAENGAHLHHLPSTPIGALDTRLLHVVARNNNATAKRVAARPAQPFQTTFRLQVHLPRNQLFVTRVGPDTCLSDVLRLACVEKDLDPAKYELRHPANLQEKLLLSHTLGDYRLQEVTLVACRPIGAPITPSDIMALHKEEEKRRQQVKATGSAYGMAFNKRSRAGVPAQSSGSVSSDSLNGRSISPTRSDESASRSVSPLAPEPPKRPGRKRRPAPMPPAQVANEQQNDSSQGVLREEATTCHSRTSSDSSGYHEASVLSETLETRANGDSAGDTLPRRSKLPPTNEMAKSSAEQNGSSGRSAKSSTLQHGSSAVANGHNNLSRSLSNLNAAVGIRGQSLHSVSTTSLASHGVPSRKKKAAPPPPPGAVKAFAPPPRTVKNQEFVNETTKNRINEVIPEVERDVRKDVVNGNSNPEQQSRTEPEQSNTYAPTIVRITENVKPVQQDAFVEINSNAVPVDRFVVDPLPLDNSAVKAVQVESVDVKPVPVDSAVVKPMLVENQVAQPVPIDNVVIHQTTVPVSIAVKPVPVESAVTKPVPVESTVAKSMPVERIDVQTVPVESIVVKPAPVESIATVPASKEKSPVAKATTVVNITRESSLQPITSPARFEQEDFSASEPGSTLEIDSTEWEYHLPAPPTAFRDLHSPTTTEFETIKLADTQVFQEVADFSENEFTKESNTATRETTVVENKPQEKRLSLDERDTNENTGSPAEIVLERSEVQRSSAPISFEDSWEPQKLADSASMLGKFNNGDLRLAADGVSREVYKVNPIFDGQQFEQNNKAPNKLVLDEREIIEKSKNLITRSSCNDLSSLSVLKNFTISAYEKPKNVDNLFREDAGDKVFKQPAPLVRTNSYASNDASRPNSVKRSTSYISLARPWAKPSSFQSIVRTKSISNLMVEEEHVNLRKASSEVNVSLLESNQSPLHSVEVLKSILPQIRQSQPETPAPVIVPETEPVKEEIPTKTEPPAFVYRGPPSINFASWSERPKSQVSLKSDKDYRIGGFGSSNNLQNIQANVEQNSRNSSSTNTYHTHIDKLETTTTPYNSEQYRHNSSSNLYNTKPERQVSSTNLRSTETFSSNPHNTLPNIQESSVNRYNTQPDRQSFSTNLQNTQLDREVPTNVRNIEPDIISSTSERKGYSVTNLQTVEPDIRPMSESRGSGANIADNISSIKPDARMSKIEPTPLTMRIVTMQEQKRSPSSSHFELNGTDSQRWQTDNDDRVSRLPIVRAVELKKAVPEHLVQLRNKSSTLLNGGSQNIAQVSVNNYQGSLQRHSYIEGFELTTRPSLGKSISTSQINVEAPNNNQSNKLVNMNKKYTSVVGINRGSMQAPKPAPNARPNSCIINYNAKPMPNVKGFRVAETEAATVKQDSNVIMETNSSKGQPLKTINGVEQLRSKQSWAPNEKVANNSVPEPPKFPAMIKFKKPNQRPLEKQFTNPRDALMDAIKNFGGQDALKAKQDLN